MKRKIFLSITTVLLLSTPIFSQTFENAEDGTTKRWRHSGNVTTTIVMDNITNSKVIKFNSSKYTYSRIDIKNDKNMTMLKWDMKVNQGYYIYIGVTTDKGKETLFYNALNINYNKKGIQGIHHGLGTNSTNNQWHTFKRNIVNDLKDGGENKKLISIDYFKVRTKGEAYLDNIQTLVPLNNPSIEPITTIPDQDTTPPEIILNGKEFILLDLNAEYVEEEAIALDNVDDSVPVKITGHVDTSKEGIYKITYTAIDSSNNIAKKVRTIQVKKDTSIKPPVVQTPSSSSTLISSVIEDAEDGSIERWRVSGDGIITNIYDVKTSSRVLHFHSEDYQYRYYRINIPNGEHVKRLKWDMKLRHGFALYIDVTTQNGARTLYYNKINRNEGIKNGAIHHGLGYASINTVWHSYNRNLEQDLQDFEPNNKLISVDFFRLRVWGDTFVDNFITINK